MNDFTKGQLIEICQAVFRGSKPCGVMAIKTNDKQLAKIVCMKEGVKFRIKKSEGEWCNFWVYFHDELMRVIDLLPNTPTTAADHYLNGALFGYSTEMICKFLENQKTDAYKVEINGNEFPIHKEVFDLIKVTSKERDLYRLLKSN